MRGMAVEDDSSYRHTQQPYKPGGQPSRHPHTAQRVAYGAYPGTEYSSYYPTQSGQVDYGYGYTTDPSLYVTSPVLPSAPATVAYPTATSPPMHMADPRQQANVYYDYPGAVRMGSPYFYPAQAIVYQPSAASPLMAHQTSGGMPATLSEKKREMQVGFVLLYVRRGIAKPSIVQRLTEPDDGEPSSCLPIHRRDGVCRRPAIF